MVENFKMQRDSLVVCSCVRRCMRVLGVWCKVNCVGGVFRKKPQTVGSSSSCSVMAVCVLGCHDAFVCYLLAFIWRIHHCELKIASNLVAISSKEGRLLGSACQHSWIKVLVSGQGMIWSRLLFEGRSSSYTTLL